MLWGRRDILAGGAAALIPLPASPRAAEVRTVRVASNQGIENATLQHVMADRGFARQFGIDLALVESRDIAGPIAALESGRADMCMVSAFAGVLPAIEAGQPIRLIGAAMQLPALALFAADPALGSVRALAGRRIGIGEAGGLLHLLMLALLRSTGMADGDVTFVHVGSNAQVFQAIVSGQVDAGPCGIAGLSDPRVHVVAGGALWQALPEFTYQLAYASRDALAARGEALARCLAAYAALFRFVSSPGSREAYLAARSAAGGDRAGGEQVWDFIQRTQPYARDPGLSRAHLAYLQALNVRAGLQHTVMPFDRIADLAPAAAAKKLLDRQPGTT